MTLLAVFGSQGFNGITTPWAPAPIAATAQLGAGLAGVLFANGQIGLYAGSVTATPGGITGTINTFYLYDAHQTLIVGGAFANIAASSVSQRASESFEAVALASSNNAIESLGHGADTLAATNPGDVIYGGGAGAGSEFHLQATNTTVFGTLTGSDKIFLESGANSQTTVVLGNVPNAIEITGNAPNAFEVIFNFSFARDRILPAQPSLSVTGVPVISAGGGSELFLHDSGNIFLVGTPPLSQFISI